MKSDFDEKKICCILLSAVLLFCTTSISSYASQPESNANISTYEALGEYCYYYEIVYNKSKNLTYERNHKYRTIDIPSGLSVKFNEWGESLSWKLGPIQVTAIHTSYVFVKK